MNPWEKEKNYEEFVHKGIHCIVKKNPEMLHLLGYADVEADHPFYEILT